MKRGWLGRLAALAALLGVLFASSASPPLPAFDPLRGAVLCHASGSGPERLPGDEVPQDPDCCLPCQMASLANSLLPPQGFGLPRDSATHARPPISPRVTVEGIAARHAKARAPPLA